MKKAQVIFKENLLSLFEWTPFFHSASILRSVMQHTFVTAWTKTHNAPAQFLTTLKSGMNIRSGEALKAENF